MKRKTDMVWYEIQTDKKTPVWTRSFYIANDGECFLPAVLFGQEFPITLMLSYDGCTLMTHKNHAYVPLSWATKNFPFVFEQYPGIKGSIAKAVLDTFSRNVVKS
jgi:hypothetical protein